MVLRVALFFDQYARDFTGLFKIKNELEKRGVVCGIAASVSMLEYSILFRPDAIVIGNPDLYHGEFATLLSDNTRIFSIPTEQSIFIAKYFSERTVEGHNKNNTDYEIPNINIVEKFFLWSEYHREALIQAGIPDSKLLVSGNPRLSVRPGEREEFCVGVPLETQFSHSLPYEMWAYDGIDTAYGPMLDYFTLAINILDKQLKVIRALTHEGYRVIVRPRLSDMDTDYSFLGSHIEIDRAPDPAYLLNKCHVVVTGQSTVGLEAYIYGAKVISVLGMVKESLVTDTMKNNLLFQHPMQPKTIDELIQAIGQSSTWKPQNEFLKKVDTLMGANLADPEKRIADEIIRSMEETALKPFGEIDKERKLKLSGKYGLIRGLMIRNKDNLLGKILSLLQMARWLLRNKLRFHAPK